jgi:hypothetical protein
MKLIPGTYVFEARGIDYATPEEAIAAVEARGSGTVVKFYLERNLPDWLPEVVHRSVGLWSFGDGHPWRKHSIYDGWGAAYEESRPS